MGTFHFLRPWWFLAILPLLGFVFVYWKNTPKLQAWSAVCDSHLLAHLLKNKHTGKRLYSMSCLFMSMLFMIISAAGPTWHELPVPTYKTAQARVLVLDMSSNMMARDLTPDRLSRAKFKLHDLLKHKDIGQFGLVVFTGEPFVVSPLTDDGETIASLLPALTPDIMPVGGRKLASALDEAQQLIQQAGYQEGQIFVLTSDVPSDEDIAAAKKLAKDGIDSSIMPVRMDKQINPLFNYFADSGQGQVIHYSSDSDDIDTWIYETQQQDDFALNKNEDLALWRDEGPWLLIPALIFLLPVFRRGWVQRVGL